MNRRSFIGTLAATPIAGVAVADPAGSVVEQVQHHVDEIWRLLEASAPEGTRLHRSFFVMGRDFEAMASSDDFKKGQPYSKFRTDTGGWRTTT